MKDPDTGYIAEVPESQQLEIDLGEGSDASYGGVDDDGLDEIYNNPGEVVKESLE